MSEYIGVTLNREALERLLKWYDAYQNRTETMTEDVKLQESNKYYLRHVD